MRNLITELWIVGTAGLLPLTATADSYEPRVGQRHADFTLPSIRDGKAVSLSEFHGRKVLLIQFAAW
jgi:hypothetical protein